MRKVVVVLLGSGLLLAGAARAAEEQGPTPPTQMAVEKERQRIVAANVKLSSSEAEKFWPLYKAYRAEKNQLLVRSTKLQQQYRANAAKIDDAKAREMMRRMQKIREKEFELRRTYVERFAEFLPMRKLLRYYQVENRLEAITIFELTRLIPMRS